jgi:two-component system, cell cycle sensor histidine kinase and response regulator CckA
MSEPLRVLLVEDSLTDAKLVLHALERGCGPVQSERVEDALAMRAALETGTWDAIISDWSMPAFSGLEALALVKSLGLDVPFFIVSGTIGDDVAVEAMRAGARDYLLKAQLTRLAPAVEREIREGKDRRARRLAEQALGLSEARFARLSESGIIGIVVADVTGTVHEANDAYLNMMGYTRSELVGVVPWTDTSPPEWAALDRRAFEQLTATGVAPMWEKELYRKDGTRVPILIGAAMLDGQNCISFIADLTARKQTEAALRRSEEQLRHAQKMEAIGILAGGVAHDFNNLLSVVLSYSEMLMQDLLESDPMRGDLDEIKRAGERGTALTRQLLAFSRQQILEPQVIDLNSVIENMDKMLRRLIREDVTLQTIPLANLGNCKSDVGQIEQVIMNLVVNARDAMPNGGSLTIATANADLDEAYATTHHGVKVGRYVMLSVADTGIGMDEATQARIFEPFFTTKEKGKGTGLGLSTVFGIVEQSGGSVWVTSEPGQGTTFKVYLPRTDEARLASSPRIAITTLHGLETILLVEDEDQIRLVAREILQRHGYHVIEARNAGEALLTCEQHVGTIPLLLTDLVMPQMNGKQLADRLGPLHPEMKVLFMSGYTDGVLVGQLASGSAFLQKPLTPSALTRKVREVLDSTTQKQLQ